MLEEEVKEKELKNGENPMMMIMMFLKIEQGLFLPSDDLSHVLNEFYVNLLGSCLRISCDARKEVRRLLPRHFAVQIPHEENRSTTYEKQTALEQI